MKGSLLAALAVVGLGAPRSLAAEPGTRLDLRPSLYIEKPYYSVSCSNRLLDLCIDKPKLPSGSHSRWNNIGIRVDMTRASPNRLLKVTKLFIDDIQVGHIGPMKVKLFISIE